MTKPLTQADFDGPYIRESTGLQYKDFASWLAGDEPLDTPRNDTIIGLRLCAEQDNDWPAGSVEAFWRAYDGASPVPDPRGDFGDEHTQRHIAGILALQALATA